MKITKGQNTRRDEAKNEHVQNIRAGLPVLKTLYGLTIDEYDYIDIAIDALRDIRHYGTTEYVAYMTVGKGGVIPMPCNATFIDAIVTSRTGSKMFYDRVKYDLEGMWGTDSYYFAEGIIKGLGGGYLGEGLGYYGLNYPGLADFRGEGFISYQLSSNEIKVDAGYEGHVLAIAFTGISTDPEGYPLITRKQANAIAALCAKSIAMKGVFKGDKIMSTALEFAINNAARLKQAASMSESITDNELEELLDAKVSFNRKSYRRPSKYSR